MVNRFSGSWSRPLLWRRAVLGVFFFALLTALFAGNLLPDRLSVKVGDVAPELVRAPKEFIDWPATNGLREEAAARVDDKYELDRSVDREVLSEVAGMYARLKELRALPPATAESPEGMTGEAKIEEVRRITGLDLSEGVLGDILSADEATVTQLEEDTRIILEQVLEGGIKESAVETFRREAGTQARQMGYDKSLETFLGQLVQAQVRPNLFFDQEETIHQKQRAMAEIEPVKFSKGQTIVPEGAKLVEDDIIHLRDAGLLGEGGDYPSVMGSALLALLLVGLAATFLFFYRPGVYNNDSLLLLFGLVVVLTLLISRIIWPISGFLMPVSAGGMLLAILLDEQIAFLGVVVISVAVGFLTGGEMDFMFVSLLGSAVAIYGVNRVAQRSDLMRAGFTVSLVNGVSILALILVAGRASIYQVQMWWDLLWGLTGGIFAAVLTIGSLPFFESLFGLLTSIKLLELSNSNQPLLRKLLMEAPGTYHHSIMVGNLAEGAAEAVGGDALLARVGAYYHDIGKIKRPYFFVENQLGGRNPHDKISPNLSALIVTAHVKDGLELARSYGLPQEIRAFIEQHHGTTLVSYFFNRATENGKTEQILEANFHHDGPIPQSRETAIVMLADACEAAVRSLGRPTPGRIEGVVRKLVKDRLEQGQLDQSDLTLRDLDLIAATFSRVLSGIFHGRIEYPESVLREMEGQKRKEQEHSGDVPPGPKEHGDQAQAASGGEAPR